MSRSYRMFILIPIAFIGCQTTVRVQEGTPTPSPTPCEPTRTGGHPTHAFLKDVRVGTHDGYDRVTFEFEPTSGVPKFQMDPVDPPFTKDNEEAMQVEGNKFARIIFHGGTGVEIGSDGYRETYTGRRELTPKFEVLREAEEAGDFEATLSWVFGLSRDSCWKVTEITDPLRASIDFSH